MLQSLASYLPLSIANIKAYLSVSQIGANPKPSLHLLASSGRAITLKLSHYNSYLTENWKKRMVMLPGPGCLLDLLPERRKHV